MTASPFLVKLLGWMHQKFQQSNSETHNHFSIGELMDSYELHTSEFKYHAYHITRDEQEISFRNELMTPDLLRNYPSYSIFHVGESQYLAGQQSLDDLRCYPKTNYCSKPLDKSLSEKPLRNSFAGLEAGKVEEENVEEESSAALTELFHGFLATGTVGSETINTDPSTPTFSISVDHIAEKDTEVKENELKLINFDLEKVLGGEGRDESCNLSFGRNSHVSARSSIFTLSGKQIENAAINENEGITCPLQSYLFGSAIGSPETAPPTKKEHRTSLGDLFHKTKLVDENPGDKSGRTEKQNDESVVHILTRMICGSTTEASRGHLDSASAEKKLLKILQMFHRKIHPESSTDTRKSQKPVKNYMKCNIMSMSASHNGGLMPTAEDIKICPRPTISKERIGNFKSQSYLPQFTLNSGDASGNREHWDKTDEDYLVLEL